jgi:hypothetical protein
MNTPVITRDGHKSATLREIIVFLTLTVILSALADNLHSRGVCWGQRNKDAEWIPRCL